MKNMVVILLAVLLFVGLASDCQARTLRVGIDHWPPYEYMDGQGRARGLAVDIFNAVLKRMDEPAPRYQPMPWKRGLYSLQHGDVDVLLSGVYAEGRKTFTRYPEEPLVESNWSLFGLTSRFRRHGSFNNLEDFKGMSAGLVIGYEYPGPAMQYILDNLETETSISDTINLRKVRQGRLDLALGEVRNLTHLIRGMGLQLVIQPVGPALRHDNLYALFSRRSTTGQFVERFSRALARFRKTEAYRQLLNHHESGALQPGALGAQ